MRTDQEPVVAEAVLDKRHLQALGVLLPVHFQTLSFLPGRHPLGRAGEGMRFLRTRDFEPGEDNPRDIDKFSPVGQRWVTEWESEAQASIRVLGDVSASMAFRPKAAIRNLALLQLNYSLWRACDRVRTLLYNRRSQEEFAERNLRTQMDSLAQRLGRPGFWGARQDVFTALKASGTVRGGKGDDLLFMVSDFCSVSSARPERARRDWRSTLRQLSCALVPVIVTFELSRSLRGSIKLWDPELGSQRLTFLSPRRVDSINEREKQRVLALEALFRQLGVDYLTLRSERDVYPQLARLAKLRRRRRL